MIGIIVFWVLAVITFLIAGKKYLEIYQNINLGKDDNVSGNTVQRLKNMALIAFGQKKMFKNLIPALLHLMVYVAFVVTQIELIEIFIDGFSGGHRQLLAWFGTSTFFKGFYIFLISFIEILSVLALVATIIFLWRRNMLKIPRFWKEEMKGWPFKDANLILIFEVILVACIFTMNGADEVLYNNGVAKNHIAETGSYGFAISQYVGPALFGGLSNTTLWWLERIAWWGHITLVFIFLNYLPYSKHLHIMLAFPNTFFASLKPKGYVNNMPDVTKEIKLMMNPDTAFAPPPEGEQEIPTFGAKDVQDLKWTNILNAYSCTECGRCTSACPANQTGKKLSPRKVMMDVRDRAEEVGANVRKNGEFKNDGKSLISDDFISVEELRACTTCNACVEECPIMINPLDIIIQLRRNLILEQSSSPEEWNNMFSNIENNGAPWQFSQQDRANWINE